MLWAWLLTEFLIHEWMKASNLPLERSIAYRSNGVVVLDKVPRENCKGTSQRDGIGMSDESEMLRCRANSQRYNNTGTIHPITFMAVTTWISAFSVVSGISPGDVSLYCVLKLWNEVTARGRQASMPD